MRRALLWAALLLALPAAASVDEAEEAAEDDEETDTAPFTVVVEHSDGWRCGGSLVSLRTVLTSGRCARGRGGGGGGGGAVWVRAGPLGARRAARRALAAGADLGVLELQAALGAGARPILMARRPAACAAPRACHVVRARPAGLRIVDAPLSAPAACGPAAARRPAADRPLCLVGPTLCENDWGAGVVCNGKLCGVVSGPAEGERGPATEGGGGGEGCGVAHVAPSVVRWRRFLHCAHTLRDCGRGGECAELCTEQQLLPAVLATPAGPPAGPPARPPPAPARWPGAGGASRTSARTDGATHTETAPLNSPASHSPRPAFEFEPNRPDFKAGEYGDNAAEYGSEEGGAGRAPPAPPAPHAPPTALARVPPAAPPSPPPAPRPAHAARSAAPHTPAAADRRVALIISLFCLLI